MKVCILENDALDPVIAPVYKGYGAMIQALFQDVGATWEFEVFHTPSFEYPTNFDDFDAVVLSGSKADSFSDAPWVVTLRERVSALLQQNKKLLGICFGHQLIAYCLGGKVGRAPQGWGVGRMSYTWNANSFPVDANDQQFSLLASHQDQIVELPPSATLLASSAHCPIAAYAIGEQVFCVQGHPEFVESYSEFLLNKRRDRLGEAHYKGAIESLAQGHDGQRIARMMVAFVEN